MDPSLLGLIDSTTTTLRPDPTVPHTTIATSPKAGGRDEQGLQLPGWDDKARVSSQCEDEKHLVNEKYVWILRSQSSKIKFQMLPRAYRIAGSVESEG